MVSTCLHGENQQPGPTDLERISQEWLSFCCEKKMSKSLFLCNVNGFSSCWIHGPVFEKWPWKGGQGKNSLRSGMNDLVFCSSLCLHILHGQRKIPTWTPFALWLDKGIWWSCTASRLDEGLERRKQAPIQLWNRHLLGTTLCVSASVPCTFSSAMGS